MPDLQRAIDELRHFASSPSPHEPDLDRIAGRVRSRRRRRRVALVGAMAAIIVTGAAVVMAPDSDDPAKVEVAGDPDEATPEPDPAVLPTGALVSGPVGIAQVDLQSMTLVYDRPTAIAFNLGSGVLVAQGADPAASVYPLPPAGPVLVVEGDQVREIALADGEQPRLLDATIIDGRPTALVSGRRGTTPDDTEEELFLVDIESGTATSLGVVGGWESGVRQARFGEAHIATLLDTEGGQLLVVRTLDGSVVWDEFRDVMAPSVSIAVDDGELVVVEARFEGDDFTPTMTTERFDLATGDKKGSTDLTLDPEPGLEIAAGFCFHTEWASSRLYCDRSDGSPIEVHPTTGATRAIPGIDSGLVTLPRTAAPEASPTGSSGACPGSVLRRVDGGDPQADSLPPLSSSVTDSALVRAVLEDHSTALLDQYNAGSVKISHGFGRALAGTNGGTFATVDLEDYGILVTLDSTDLCPSGAGLHRMIDEVPLFFHVGSTDPPMPDPDHTVPLAAREPVEALIRFAQTPSTKSAGGVPFADTVGIGLGPELLRDLDSTARTDPQAWQLELDGRWASEGAVSALEELGTTPALSLTRDRAASCGSTSSPPVPPELTSLTRLSVVPTKVDSCLFWFAVDIYLDEAGSIAAVTLELYEP